MSGEHLQANNVRPPSCRRPGLARARRAAAVVSGAVSGAVSRGVIAGVAAVALGGTGCDGPALEGWDVTLTPIVECTQTNLNLDCTDAEVLAQTTVEARWIIERASAGIGIVLTTHEGQTLPGWRFANDRRVTEVPGCLGEGGECSFVRYRTSVVDVNDNNCRRETNRVFAGHSTVDDDELIEGFFSDLAGVSAECGTATNTEFTWAVSARRAAEPVLARDEVQP
jgi:hypothetical protein